jgi:hypothetical protein
MIFWHPLRRIHSDAWQVGYNAGYEKGLEDGQDFGKRIAYNQVLNKELPRILSRYSQLQVKIMHKPKTEMQAALSEFTQKELDHFKMELQDR